MYSHIRNFLQQHFRTARFWVAIACVLLIVVSCRLYQASNGKNTRQPTVTVMASRAWRGEMPVYLPALGSVTPTQAVTLRTQVNGKLMRVLFQEGQIVQAGDLLAEIDARPFEAQLKQNEGQLARDTALLANAKMDLARYQRLWRQNSVARQTLDTQVSLVKQLEGTVQLDQGLVESARVNLNYCRVIAPIHGRVGLRLVDAGNFVQVSDPNGLAVINTLDPITVVFTLPEDNLPQLMRQLRAHRTLTVKAYDRAKEKLLAIGTLLTVDNQIDPTTGTVKLKAQFQNPENQLFPNQFVNVRLLVETLHDVVIVPAAAIQQGATENYVYQIDTQNNVHIKMVKTGTSEAGYTVITAGVSAGDRLVIEGGDKLTEGNHVAVVYPERGSV